MCAPMIPCSMLRVLLMIPSVSLVSLLFHTRVVRTRSDTIPINPDPEPYLLISQPHLDLAIPFPVSPLRIRSSRLASLHFGLRSTFPLSSASDPLS